MKNKRKKRPFLDELYKQYKVVVSNDRTFEERLSFKINKLGVFLISFIYTSTLIALTICLVFFTQLKEYVPGYSSLELLKNTTEQGFKLDSIEKVMKFKNQYYNSIKKVLTGELDSITFNSDSIINKISSEKISSELNPSKEDTLLRRYIEEEDLFNLTSSQLLTENKTLFLPVQGEITQKFNRKEDHFAIDIAADTGTPIKAISGGRILFADWTIQTGYVLIVDHGDMLVSVYKHNSKLIKNQNETVSAGEIIALSGNHGTLTSGPHLHFEVWKNGAPIDPAELFNFK